MKNINIKVNRLIAITELENKLVEVQAQEAEVQAQEDAYVKHQAQFQTDVKNELIAGNFEWSTECYGDPIDMFNSTTIRSYIKLTDMPALPQRPSSNRPRNTVSVKDIERMIRLLKMSTDESVSTKVYDSLGEML